MTFSLLLKEVIGVLKRFDHVLSQFPLSTSLFLIMICSLMIHFGLHNILSVSIYAPKYTFSMCFIVNVHLIIHTMFGLVQCVSRLISQSVSVLISQFVSQVVSQLVSQLVRQLVSQLAR